MKKFETEDILTKLKKYLGVNRDTDLAKRLEVSRQIVYKWKQRDSINLFLIVEKCPNLSIDWLLFGIGEPELEKNKIIKLSESEFDVNDFDYTSHDLLKIAKAVAFEEDLKINIRIESEV